MFAEFLKKKSSNEKKRRRRRTDSPISQMNELIINENLNPNQLINGNQKNEEINGNNIYDINDESLSINESNVFQLNETLKQREAVIKQLSERLQLTLHSRDHIEHSAECMASEIEGLKNQLKFMSTSLLSKTYEEQHSLRDFECQTEWNEESSIEYGRRQSESELSQQITPIGVNTFNTFSPLMEDKSEQTIQMSEYFCEHSVQTDSDLLHLKCKQDLEKLKYNLMIEFNERERKIESTLMEQLNQLEVQMKTDKNIYLNDNKKLDNQIECLKTYINELEIKQKIRKSEEKDFPDEDLHNFKVRNSGSSSPFVPNSPFLLQNQSEIDSHSTSRSPIFQTLQNCNNWSQSHPDSPHEPDIENIEYVAQTPIENSRLLHVLSDLVKTFIDTEHDIQKQLIDMGIENRVTNKEEFLQSFVSLNEDMIERLSETNDLCEDGPDLTPNSNGMYFTPPSGQNEVEMEEDVVLGASRRLRTAVDRVLRTLSEMVSKQSENDFNSVLKKNEELLSELNEEYMRRNKLSAQLLHIEDRVKCLEKEKTSLSEKLIDYNEMKRQLESIRTKLNEYESERDKWINDNKRLAEERISFTQGLPQLQKISNNSTNAQNTALFANTELVNDNESLNSDVLQLQQERLKLLQRIHALTLESEQLRSERDDILDEKRREFEDFVAQIESNEKNLLSYRKFIDEQTHERELERDEYNKELVVLTERLKDKDKNESKLRSRLEEMETQLNCLTDEKAFKEKQLNDINCQLKSANNEIIELRAIVTQMERESDKSSQLERQLRSKIDCLNEALEIQISFNEESQHEVLANNILEQITSKTTLLQNTLGSVDGESESEETSNECSFNDARLLSERLNALNECIDKLMVQNKTLKCDLERITNDKNKDFQELIKEKESLDRNLTEILRSNEILKEELNSKHLQLSALKSRLESTLDSSDMKYMVEELQNKLISEEQKNNKLNFEINSLKQQMDDKNNRTLQLMDELNSLKRQIKTIDSEKCSLMRENDELRLKLSSKDAILSAIRRKGEEDVNESKQLSREIEKYKKTIESIQSEKSFLMKESEDLRTKICANEEILVSMRQQIQQNERKELKLTENNDLLNQKLNVLNSDKSNITKENADLKSKLCSLNAVLISLNERVDQKNAKTLELIDRVDSLTTKLKLVDSEKVKSIKANNELMSKLSQFNKTIHELKCQISEEQIKSLKLLEEIESLKSRLKSLETEKERLLKENSSLRAKLNSNDEILIVLKQQIDEKNNRIKNLNELIDKMKSNFFKFESENRDRKEREKLDLNSRKSLHVLSEKTTEDEDRLNGVSNQLLWKLKRVISHKNALIHQKKYLLHVLGGFQLTERATLALLANMNVTVDDELPAFKSSKNRFRSVVYSVIAISRMKLLVKKWKSSRNQIKTKPNVMKTVSTNSLGATNELQTDSTLQEFVNRLQRLHDTLGLRTGQI